MLFKDCGRMKYLKETNTLNQIFSILFKKIALGFVYKTPNILTNTRYLRCSIYYQKVFLSAKSN